MATVGQIRRFRRFLMYAALVLVGLFFLFLVFVDRFVEPILRKRLHTLIVQGSDSLYTYQLGDLKANFFGGNVEVENLQINIDSGRYKLLKSRGTLPALTMQLNLQKGRVKGISLIGLIFSKKISVQEIMSRQADIKLSRHPQKSTVSETDVPFWKSIQPEIASISVDRIRLDGVKLLYRNADTSESVKLQFDECHALFEDIRIDSNAAFDTTRIGFTKNIYMRFHDLKYRTADSAYKMKAEWITYSSKNRTFELDSFKLQPTFEKEDLTKASAQQRSWYYIEFAKARLRNFRLDRFLHKDIIDADSAVFTAPDVSIYLDRSLPPNYESKIGKYPHQKLLSASSVIRIKNISFTDAKMEYREKNMKTLKEGEVKLHGLSLNARNVTNDPALIKLNPVCTADIKGSILGSSPIAVQFRFYLDSTNGRYDATGSLQNITAAQLSPLAASLANVQINSFNIQQLNFQVSGVDQEAYSNVRLRYNNLSLTLKKTDDETGITSTNKFLTKILNKFVIWPDNPGPDGVERTAHNSRVLRLTTQSFFGLFWKAIFSGMQDVMMKSGRYG
jgi:hypothetical protein